MTSADWIRRVALVADAEMVLTGGNLRIPLEVAEGLDDLAAAEALDEVAKDVAAVGVAEVAAGSAEVDAIERGVNALLGARAWDAGNETSIHELCDLAEGLAAFLEWNHDIPGSRTVGRRDTGKAPAPSQGLHG